MNYVLILFLLCLLEQGFPWLGVPLFVKEGDSVTLLSNRNIRSDGYITIKWWFQDTVIAEMNPFNRHYCTDVQCNEGTERFRDRLKLDHQTGSLTITNTTNTDSGEYKLQINSSRFSIIKSFSVSVTAAAEEISAAVIGGGVVLLLVVAAAAVGVIYYCRRRSTQAGTNGNRKQDNNPQGNDGEGVALRKMVATDNGSSSSEAETTGILQ